MPKQTNWILRSWLIAGLLASLTIAPKQTFAGEPRRLLVVTVTKGFHHSSIPTAEKTLKELGKKNDLFTVDYVRNDDEMKEKMTTEALKKYDGVIFANTTGILPLPDKEAFLNWIKSGKAFIGMHSATDTFHARWGIDPYIAMIGGEFKEHHAQVEVECLSQDIEHPATRHLGKSYMVKDEIYLMKNFDRGQVHALLMLNNHPNTNEPGDYPIAWCKKYGKGNVFYTSLGHRDEVWESPAYQQHILGGIKWALGLEKGRP
jgi:type 1 glutamine amidotransferase